MWALEFSRTPQLKSNPPWYDAWTVVRPRRGSLRTSLRQVVASVTRTKDATEINDHRVAHLRGTQPSEGRKVKFMQPTTW